MMIMLKKMVDSTSKCKINKNDQRKLSLEKRN